MAWTYPELAAADAALSPQIADPVAAAAALNAQTVPAPVMAVSVAAVHGALMLSITGDWLRIEARALAPYSSGYPGSMTPGDQVINAAKLALELAASKVEMIDPAHWAAFLAFLGALHADGEVSDASLAAITALAQPSPTLPKWTPPPTGDDITHARSIA